MDELQGSPVSFKSTTKYSKTFSKSMPTTKTQLKFTGKLQPVTSRHPVVPSVNYEKGGDDFRCPTTTSSFGRQILGYSHTQSSNRPVLGTSQRFRVPETYGVGPNALAPVSSMRNQSLSNRRSAESTNFGTSTRDGALKLYAVYTCKKF